MRIYTRTGDFGETGLFGGERVYKDDLRVDAYGTVDELNAVLGVAIALRADADLDALLLSLQNDLFYVGADLATPQEEALDRGRVSVQRVAPSMATRLETLIDEHEVELTPLTRFILPGGSHCAAMLHLARTVCRRAERLCVTLARSEAENRQTPLNSEIITYLNRLSDLLFVLARVANHRQRVADIEWNP